MVRAGVTLPEGVCGDVVRNFAWVNTPLGRIESWSVSLLTLVRTVLASPIPSALWWGPERIQIHNDAMLAILGANAIGKPAHVPDAADDYRYGPAFDDAGNVAGVLVVWNDTERARRRLAEAETELHAVFMQAPMPIAVLIGPEHVYALSNPAYDAMVGRPTLGKRVLEAFTTAEVGDFVPLLDRVYRTGEPITIHEAELHLAKKDGGVTHQYIDATYHAYRNPEGAIVGVMALHNDVTNGVLARKEEEAKRKAQDDFLAMLGHELRNPLAPIATATTLMKMRGDHHPKERQVIDRQVAQLGRLVDDLLDVARISRGRIELRRAPTSVRDVMDSAVETMSTALAAKDQLIEVDVDESLFVDGDAARLAQVFSNLLGNATKYTQAGGKIAVSATRADDQVVVTIADNGPGIAPDLLPRVFDLFVQGEQRIDRPQGGLGLGLALVKRLVALHGGTVGAANGANGGAKLTVSLPAIDEPAETQRSSVAPAETTAPKRVLVVDDNRDHAELLSAFLRSLGHDVRMAFDGHAALAALHSFDAQIGLLDLGLPEMDGFELARRIRHDAPRVNTLIAATGYGQPRDREATAAAGFDAHLVKPLDLKALAQLIDATRTSTHNR
jgi:signal transduction histidine kinase/ActR/RegA family two-component response regulator